MPKKKKEESIEELDSKIEEALQEAKKTSFEIYNKDGEYVRTYSVEIHGENAEALANEFASHTGGKVV